MKISMGEFDVQRKNGGTVLDSATYSDISVDFGEKDAEEILAFLVGSSSSIRVKVQGILRKAWTAETGFSIQDGTTLHFTQLYAPSERSSVEDVLRRKHAGDAERMAAVDLLFGKADA